MWWLVGKCKKIRNKQVLDLDQMVILCAKHIVDCTQTGTFHTFQSKHFSAHSRTDTFSYEILLQLQFSHYNQHVMACLLFEYCRILE